MTDFTTPQEVLAGAYAAADELRTAVLEHRRLRSEAVAGAYAAAAHCILCSLDGAGDHPTAQAMRRVYADLANQLFALTPADATAALDRIKSEAVAPLEAEITALRAQVARVAVSAEYLVDQEAGEFDRQIAMKDIRAALREIRGGNV